MLKELTGYFNSIKKTQAEMKFTLISEINKNLQGTNCGVMKLRIKSLIWNIREKKFNQNSKKKKEFKK